MKDCADYYKMCRLLQVCEKCLKIIGCVGDTYVHEEYLQFIHLPLIRSWMRVLHGKSSIELLDVT